MVQWLSLKPDNRTIKEIILQEGQEENEVNDTTERSRSIREAKKIRIPIARKNKERSSAESTFEDGFKTMTEKKVIQIPHINVIEPKEGEVIAVGPEIIKGSEIAPVLHEEVTFNQV